MSRCFFRGMIIIYYLLVEVIGHCSSVIVGWTNMHSIKETFFLTVSVFPNLLALFMTKNYRKTTLFCCLNHP